ncbi:MAG: helix-turn-helix transcriptional regulator [Bacteroidota bacterium]
MKKKLRRTIIKYFHASGPGIETLVNKMRAFEANELKVNHQQLEILQFLAKGMIINEIAIRLGMSKSNIEKKIYNLYKKFNVQNQKELIAFALKNQLL